MRGLFLDLSTRVGWALFKGPADSRPKCGTHKLPKTFDPEDYGTRGWSLMEWLEGAIEAWSPGVIAFESPFIPMANPSTQTLITTAQTLRLQITLAATIETTAKKHKIRCLEVATQSAKVAMVGFGQAPRDPDTGRARKGWDWKKEMLLAALRQGWPVIDDHQADAVAVGLVAYSSLGLDVPEPGEVTS